MASLSISCPKTGCYKYFHLYNRKGTGHPQIECTCSSSDLCSRLFWRCLILLNLESALNLRRVQIETNLPRHTSHHQRLFLKLLNIIDFLHSLVAKSHLIASCLDCYLSPDLREQFLINTNSDGVGLEFRMVTSPMVCIENSCNLILH